MSKVFADCNAAGWMEHPTLLRDGWEGEGAARRRRCALWSTACLGGSAFVGSRFAQSLPGEQDPVCSSSSGAARRSALACKPPAQQLLIRLTRGSNRPNSCGARTWVCSAFRLLRRLLHQGTRNRSPTLARPWRPRRSTRTARTHDSTSLSARDKLHHTTHGTWKGASATFLERALCPAKEAPPASVACTGRARRPRGAVVISSGCRDGGWMDGVSTAAES